MIVPTTQDPSLIQPTPGL